MARQYLAHHLGPLHVEAEIARFRDAADPLGANTICRGPRILAPVAVPGT
jgi:hypothetical protein